MTARCKNSVNDQDAVRTSIEKHLNGRADLTLRAMVREVKQIRVDGAHATAEVEFRLNGGDARMEVEYNLEPHGNGWQAGSSRSATVI